jgi:DNA-binding NarL/FixJ family response regulator
MHKPSLNLREPGKLIDLTEHEQILLNFACSELTYKEISQKLSLTEQAVNKYMTTLTQKLNVRTRVGLVMYAIKHKICTL